jgi:hypothetical protein
MVLTGAALPRHEHDPNEITVERGVQFGDPVSEIQNTRTGSGEMPLQEGVGYLVARLAGLDRHRFHDRSVMSHKLE